MKRTHKKMEVDEISRGAKWRPVKKEQIIAGDMDIKMMPAYDACKAQLRAGEQACLEKRFPTNEHVVQNPSVLLAPYSFEFHERVIFEIPTNIVNRNPTPAQDGKRKNDLEERSREAMLHDNGPVRVRLASAVEDWEPEYESDSSPSADIFNYAQSQQRPELEDDAKRREHYSSVVDFIFKAWHDLYLLPRTLHTALKIFQRMAEVMPYLEYRLYHVCAMGSLMLAAKHEEKPSSDNTFTAQKYESYSSQLKDTFSLADLQGAEERILELLDGDGPESIPRVSPHNEINKLLSRSNIRITNMRYAFALFYFDFSFCLTGSCHSMADDNRAMLAVNLCFQDINQIRKDLWNVSGSRHAAGFLLKWGGVANHYKLMDPLKIAASDEYFYKRVNKNDEEKDCDKMKPEERKEVQERKKLPDGTVKNLQDKRQARRKRLDARRRQEQQAVSTPAAIETVDLTDDRCETAEILRLISQGQVFETPLPE